MTIQHSIGSARTWSFVSAAAVMLWLLTPAQAPQTFKTPDEAAAALADAVKSGSDRNILKVLGRDGIDIVSSGDEVADRETLERFIAAWNAKHSIKTEGDKKAVMILGNDDFPFPI